VGAASLGEEEAYQWEVVGSHPLEASVA